MTRRARSAPRKIDAFIKDGFVRIDQAFPTHLADTARERLWRDTGCKPGDPATWAKPVIRLGMYTEATFIEAANTPLLHAAFDQLVGAGRWLPCRAMGTFPVRFPSPDDPGDAGWHVDASFGVEQADFMQWRVNVETKGRALLMLFLFSDVGENDAPTRIRVGSHIDIARQLAPAGEAGLTLGQLASDGFACSAGRCEALATGSGGTVYLCHPFLVHAAQPHRGTRPRFMAQPPLLPSEPLMIDGPSPVEQAIAAACAERLTKEHRSGEALFAGPAHRYEHAHLGGSAMFKLQENGTTVRTELLAGLTTYVTMVYIAFVNPTILAEAGMDRGAVFVATCLAAAFGSALMGLYANFPIAMAPGMGLNAYFTYSVVKGLGVPWEAALAAVFASGVLFLLVSITPVRQRIIDSISRSMKMAISVGIGLFLAVIGMKGGGLIAADPVTLVTLGDLKQPAVAIAVAAFILIAALDARRIHGAILIGIIAAYVAALLLGLAPFSGVASMPPPIAPVFLKMDLASLFDIGIAAVVLTLFFVVLFDNTGTILAVARAGGMMLPDGSVPRLERALVVDSTAAMAGAALGTSTTTSYIESAAGVNAGGRTGLVAVTVAILFLATLFFAPLAASIPAFATAPALIFVGCLMMAAAKDIEFDDPTEYLPAAVTIISMPLTFSIADGIAFGFIAYAGIKALAGRWAELRIAVVVLAVLFVLRFALL